MDHSIYIKKNIFFRVKEAKISVTQGGFVIKKSSDYSG